MPSIFKKSRPEARPRDEKTDLSSSRDQRDETDPIIKCSMYPQMIGKRRSELERALQHPTESDNPSSRSSSRNTRTRHRIVQQRSAALDALYGKPASTHRSKNRHVSKSRSRRASVDSDLSYDSGYESEDSINKGRPVRVSIYPQLKYCMIPGKMPAECGQRNSLLSFDEMCKALPPLPASVQASGGKCYRPQSLPQDEFNSLKRRQKMEQAREVLERHFAHDGKRQRPHVWHGLMQAYQTRNSERRRFSKIMYAVRKALSADFDLLSDEYERARHRHSAKTPWCELSDVDGVPLPDALIMDFTRTFQEVQDNAYVPKLTPLLYGKSVERTWIDERIHRAAALRRADSGIVMEASAHCPKLVSKFDWDSDNDSDREVYKRKRLTKMKREAKQ